MPRNSKYDELLSNLESVKPVGNSDCEHMARCPSHEDKTASLQLSLKDDGTITLHCHAGCRPVSIVQCAGMFWTDMFPQNDMPKSAGDWGELTVAYDYLDPDGKLAYQVCRFEKTERLPTGEEETTKTFRQRQPDGNDGWSWRTKGLQRYLYRLSEMQENNECTVFVVEGEKQTDYLRSLGFVATCNPGGAGKWQKSFTESLKGREVIIVPDNDPITKTDSVVTCPGLQHAEKVADELDGTAKSVRVVLLPEGAEPKWGLDDWIQAGDPKERSVEIVHLADSTDTWIPGTKLFERVGLDSASDDPYAYHRQVCDLLEVDVLGETENGSVMLYSRHHFKTQTFRDCSKMQFEHLVQFGGVPILRGIYMGKDKCPPSAVTMREVRSAFAALAGGRQIEQTLRGAGVWRLPEAFVVVNRGESAVLNGNGKVERLDTAGYGGEYFDLSDLPAAWFDFDALSQAYGNSGNSEWCGERMIQASGMFEQWEFSEDTRIMSEMLAGLVIATFLQSIWAWRPQIFLLGDSNVGKSVLLQALAGSRQSDEWGLFGRLSWKSADYTAAAIQQTVGCSSRVMILDEFENTMGPERTRILKMIRSTGRGDPVGRGTQHGKVRETHLQQMFWVASTESGLKREMDQNRFIMVDMAKGDEQKRRAWMAPSEDFLRGLGINLLSIGLRHAARMQELSRALYAMRPPGIHERVCESYAIPAACWASAMGMDDDQAYEVYVRMLTTFDPAQVESDKNTLISDILGSLIHIGQGQQKTVGSIAGTLLDGNIHLQQIEDHIKQMEATGVAVRRMDERVKGDKQPQCLFIYPSQVCRQLLSRTTWADQKISEYLKRIPGAKHTKRQFIEDPVKKWGYLIPISSISELRSEDG